MKSRDVCIGMNYIRQQRGCNRGTSLKWKVEESRVHTFGSFVSTAHGVLRVLVHDRTKALESGLFKAWRPCLRRRLFRQLRCVLRRQCRLPVLSTTSPLLVVRPHVTVCNRLAGNTFVTTVHYCHSTAVNLLISVAPTNLFTCLFSFRVESSLLACRTCTDDPLNKITFHWKAGRPPSHVCVFSYAWVTLTLTFCPLT